MCYFKLFFCLLSHEKDVTEKCGISRSGVKAIMKSFHSEVASFIHVCNGGFPWISKKIINLFTDHLRAMTFL